MLPFVVRPSGFPLSGINLESAAHSKKTCLTAGFFVSYRNTIDFRTPDLKITVRETTLQSSLWLFCIISRFKLQNPMILCQHLHLADGNGVEFCQPFRLRYSFIDEHSIQIFQI